MKLNHDFIQLYVFLSLLVSTAVLMPCRRNHATAKPVRPPTYRRTVKLRRSCGQLNQGELRQAEFALDKFRNPGCWKQRKR